MGGTAGDDRTADTQARPGQEPERAYPRMLPLVRIRGKLYWRDDRLEEFRAVDNVDDRIDFEVIRWILVISGKWPD